MLGLEAAIGELDVEQPARTGSAGRRLDLRGAPAAARHCPSGPAARRARAGDRRIAPRGGRSWPVRRPSTVYSRNRITPATTAKSRISRYCASGIVHEPFRGPPSAQDGRPRPAGDGGSSLFRPARPLPRAFSLSCRRDPWYPRRRFSFKERIMSATGAPARRRQRSRPRRASRSFRNTSRTCRSRTRARPRR